MEYATRQPIRLQDWDYSQAGYCFVTFCTKNRLELLGQIVGDGVLDVPFTKLTDIGRIVENQIKDIHHFYDYIRIDKYVIMPNHVHMIIIVRDVAAIGNHALQSGTSRTPSPTNAIIPALISTFKRFTSRQAGHRLWQRSYHDHIIRGEADYRKIWQYIDTNPQKWELDRYYCAANSYKT